MGITSSIGTAASASLLIKEKFEPAPVQVETKVAHEVKVKADGMPVAKTGGDCTSTPGTTGMPGTPGTTGTIGSPGVCGTPNPPQEPLTMDGLMKSWGQSGTQYDFNKDGTVNVDDLLHFINNWPADKPDGDGPGDVKPSDRKDGMPIKPENPVVDGNDGKPKDTTPTEPLTLKGLLEAWGKAETPYDFNGDGTVNTDDLLHFINNWPSEGGSSAGVVGQLNSIVGANGSLKLDANAKADSNSRLSVTRLADSLVDRLMAAGFDKQPPINLHEVINRLELKPGEKDSFVKRMSDYYPKGLGVNAVA